jgi:hypothetical protein
MRITVPEFSLVLLVGASGSGKSTFARRHFRPTEIVSSDVRRGLVADDENDQAATPDAFALLHAMLDLRLKRRRLTMVDALRLAMDMVEDGTALCVLGNHEVKVESWLQGRNVQVGHGLDRSIEELTAATEPFRERVRRFIGGLVSHYLLDGGRLAVAHAGIKEEMQGCASGAGRSAASACSARPRARWTRSGCRCGWTGPPRTGATPRWSTATHPWPRPRG